MKDKTKSLLLILVSTLAFSIMGAFVKHLQEVPVFEKVFFRNLVSLFVAFFLIVKKNNFSRGVDPGKIFGKLKNQKWLLARSLFGLLGVILNFYALSNLYLADSQILNRISPFFVSLFAFLFLKEKLKRINIIAMIVAISGAVMVIKPEFNVQVLPALAGFCSAIVAGAAYTLVRYMRTLEKPEIIVFYFSLISVIGSFPLMLTDFVRPSLEELYFLLGTGIAASVGQIGLTHAYRFSKASEVSIYTYSGIIFSSFIGFFFWHEIPDMMSIYGGFFIILSAVMVYMSNNSWRKLKPAVVNLKD